ncbi:hypothetical protein H6B11_05110 [Mediterraneibacter glycyrrhizinilyticus]|nr:hypothetical protein [Mediterraneibacter glycyrrhizinilyticus]MBM6853541.1 hypothetical protein [Mediterraneibacter glycyrrhizinilyticus]
MKLIQVGIGNANPAQKSLIFELAPGAEAAEVLSWSRPRKQPKVFELEPAAEAAKVHRLNPAVKE